jgi:putative DNA primase/helicase
MTENDTTAGGNPAAAGASSSWRGSHPDYSTNGSGAHPPGGDDDVLDEIDQLVDDSRVEPPPAASGKLSAEDAAFLLSAGQHDEGNAASVERLFPGQFLHSAAFGWLAYTGSHWVIEGAEELLDRAVVHSLARRIEAASQPETFEAGAALRKFALPNRGRLEGAKALLLSRVVAAPGDFDRDPDLLNCSSGVINLQTGTLLPHDPAQRFLHCAPVAYRPGADTSVWLRWLTGAVGVALADWLQLAVGYTLTGHTREEILFYLFGPPRAGKGLFTETLRAVLGSPLGTEIDFGTFTGKRTGDSQNFDLAPLKPCRYIAASESNSYERFNEAKLKALTGGNEVYCAYKHRDHFNYRPRFKIWLSSNQPVNADPDDDAVWGRLRVVHFPHSYLGAEDKLLKQRMRAPGVLEGVLAWAVQGALRWYALGGAGLPEPASSLAIKAEQRGALDTVQTWLDEHCILGAHHFTAFSELYGNYSQWCKDNGAEPKRQKAFGFALQHKGARADRGYVSGKQVRGFYGVKLG